MRSPSGTVTFLLTDIEGSTRLWEAHPREMAAALSDHDALAAKIICQYEGMLVKSRGEGDSLFAVFERAHDAVLAACALQQAFIQQSRPSETPLRVRMALHTGETEEREGDYYGPAVNRCARLRSIAHGGQVLLSLATEEMVRDHLPESCSLRDLASHRLKDLQQPEHVFQLVHPALPCDFPPLRSLQAFATNLPVQPSSFIGRQQEMQQVKNLLETTRLLSLTGTGGCGKTRLALQVAADLIEAYPDGVWLVELAALSDPGLVPRQVASALGLREEPGRPLLETLTDYLRPRSHLLLLDNCEHLVEPCAQLADTLLRTCPQLKILATSREPLHTPGEKVYRVPSLLVPDLAALPLEEKELGTALLEYDAVVLFVERARAQRPEFVLSRAEATLVASICDRLDGIPLAIELAAARVRVMSVEQIAARLEGRFHLLTGGARTELARHQTLLATLDWSYDLLIEKERELLRRLAVFAGGWSLETLEVVCTDEHIDRIEALDLLTSLVDKSLVIAHHRDGNIRYHLLETIRAYSLQRLKESGQESLWRRRHLDFFLNLAEESESGLAGAEQAEWLQRLQAEHENLRSAITWCQIDKECQEAGLRLAGSLRRFWEIRGYLGEGREYLQAFLSSGTVSQNSPIHAKALSAAGSLAWMQGDYAASRALHEQSLAIRRTLGDKKGIASALNSLGTLATEQGEYSIARALYAECLAIVRALGNKQGIASTLNNLGNVAQVQGEYATARALHEESLSIRRELGDKWGIAASLGNLGNAAYMLDDYAAAHAFYTESLAIRRELEDKWGIASSLNNLAEVAKEQGDYAASRALHEQSLALRRELGDKKGIASSLNNLGGIAKVQGDYAAAGSLYEEGLSLFFQINDRRGISIMLYACASLAASEAASQTANQPSKSLCASRLWGASERLREELGEPLPPAVQEEQEREMTAVRKALGVQAFAAAWEEGRAMTMERAVAFALKE